MLDYLADPSVLDYEDGDVQIPDGPDLGVTIAEDQVRKQVAIDYD